MMRLFSFLRTTSVLLVLCLSLATTTISFGLWAVSATAQVASVTASATAAAIANRKAIAAAVMRTKAKARLRRVLVAVPIAGLAAAAVFEHQDYIEWKEEHPDGDAKTYGCEISSLSAEFVDDVLQEFPEGVRPSRDLVLSQMPDCETAES